MSASPVFSSAALGRPFLFPVAQGALVERLAALRKLPARVTAAAQLATRPTPEMVSSGIRELDALTGGLPRGCLTEICGPASSGRTSILLAALASATQRGEVCALIDASDTLDPASAAAAGAVMERLLWVRCEKKDSPRRHGDTEKKKEQISNLENGDDSRSDREKAFCRKEYETPSSVSLCLRGEERRSSESQLEQVLKVTDLLLQSNGFGMIALDLGDIPVSSARRIPLVSWFRFRRAVEHTPTVLLVLEQEPIAGSCSSILLQVTGHRSQVTGKQLSAPSSQLAERKQSAVGSQHSAGRMPHTELLDEFKIEVELLCSRLERKPVQSAVTSFWNRAAWAG